MKLSELRPGDTFKLSGVLRIPGKVVSVNPGSATVEIEEKAEGGGVRRARYTWSLETLVTKESA